MMSDGRFAQPIFYFRIKLFVTKEKQRASVSLLLSTLLFKKTQEAFRLFDGEGQPHKSNPNVSAAKRNSFIISVSSH